MFVHPYHYQLMRCLIRLFVKGDHRIPLTCADREALVDKMVHKCSKGHILKVLSEGEHPREQLSQALLDELLRCVGHGDWNDFLRKHPVPDGQFYALQRAKAKKLLLLAVEKRIAELKAAKPSDGEAE